MPYVFDPRGATNPVGIQPGPYTTSIWPAAIQDHGMYARRPGGLGQESPVLPGAPAAILPTTDTSPWKTLAVVLGISLALWLLLGEMMKPGSRVRANPSGRNRVANVFRGSGGWFWKLGRKRAKRHGPYSSHCAAAEAAESAGYSVLQ